MQSDNLKCLLCGSDGADPKWRLGWSRQVVSYEDQEQPSVDAAKWFPDIDSPRRANLLALALTFGIHRGCLYERLCELYPELRARIKKPAGIE